MLNLRGLARVLLDDLHLQEVLPDGGVGKDIESLDVPPDFSLMKQWINLYSGLGRPYLLFGEMLHPPPLKTDGTTIYLNRTYPAILHNAFRAPDGREAVVAVNVTNQVQSGQLVWKGKTRVLSFAAWEAKLVEEDEPSDGGREAGREAGAQDAGGGGGRDDAATTDAAREDASDASETTGGVIALDEDLDSGGCCSVVGAKRGKTGRAFFAIALALALTRRRPRHKGEHRIRT